MNKYSISITVSALAVLISVTMAKADNSYSNAVMTLSPVAYWPLDETTVPPPVYLATNSGTLGAQANAFYKNSYYQNGTAYTLSSLFTGNSPVPGATSDGDTAAQFNGGANGNDNSGYMEIPDINHNLDQGIPFTTEAWVMPGGGDPNDPTGTSFASTEWAAIIKKGGGGAFYTENGDPENQNTYGWTIAMAGKWVLGPGGWGWYEPGNAFLQTNACWVVDFYNGANGNNPSLEFDVPFTEPTPQWFHLVLTYDGTNANFYVNGSLEATTVPGFPQSTNNVISPNQSPLTSPTGAYQFKTINGVGYAPDTLNPMVLGNINETYSFVGQGYPALNAIGFNCQAYNGALDEVGLYTNALSAATVLKHFQDASSSNHALYTNDVLSASPPVYLRLDEPASSFVEPPSDFSTFPVATNYGSMADANGAYQAGVTPGISGAAVAGFGSQSYAVQINGFDAGVDVGAGLLFGTALDPQGNPPFSVAYWFKSNPSDCYRRFQGILGRGDSGWRSSLDAGGHIRWNPGAGPELASPGNYNDGAWHQVVGVSDGSIDYLYVDGALATTGSNVVALAGSALDLLIGGAPDYTSDYTSPSANNTGNRQRYFAGQITQVAFFGTALAASDVQNLFSAAELKPGIVQNPQSLSIGLGGSGELTVSSVGSNLGYQWYQGTTQLTDVSGNIIGSSTASLTITNAQLSNNGTYSVVVSNSFGVVTSTVATVTIIPSPQITVQPSPASTTMYVGNKIAFNLTSIGAAPLSYQWYQGSSTISSATASNLVVTPAAGTNLYHCVVMNTFGAVTSSVVTVVAETFVAPAGGLVVNFAVAPGSTANQVYSGQGAYSDPGHNVWNPVPGISGTSTGLAFDSASNQVLISASLIFGFNNGSTGNATNGTPSWLVAYEDAVNSGSPGIGTSSAPEGQLTINDLPQGSYKVYLYGANYDGNRGSIFTLAAANGGVADNGINSTVNGSINGLNAIANGTCTLAEGDNYVLFTNVVTDPFGNVTATYIADTNSLSGFTGEAPFNAVQVVGTSPATLTIKVSGTSVIITWNVPTAVLQSASSLPGPYTDILSATSPYTTPLSGTQQYFRLRLQ